MSTLPSLSLQPVYFTYKQLTFQLHMPEGDTHECSLAYNQSIGDLQKVVSVRLVVCFDADALQGGLESVRDGAGRRGDHGGGEHSAVQDAFSGREQRVDRV